MSVSHFYVPAAGQTDAAARAAALGVTLASHDVALMPRYASRLGSLPAVVCDHGDEIAVLPEPTTLAVIAAAHDTLLADHLPADVARVATLAAYSPTTHNHDAAYTAAGHAAAAAPHSGHAPTSHSHVDADLPAGLARDAEVAAAYSPLVHTHSYETAGAVAAHAAAADPHPTYLTQSEGDAAYATVAHTHGIPSAGVMRVASPQTMTATAQTAVTGMSFSVAANATYYFVMSIRITTSSGTVPTTAWGFTGPASPTVVAITIEQDTSTSVEQKALLTAFGAAAAGAQVANTGAEMRGIVQTAGTAGTVQLTAARAGTTPSMVVAAGSNGFWLRVA